MSREHTERSRETDQEAKKGKINDPLTQGGTDAPQESWRPEDAR